MVTERRPVMGKSQIKSHRQISNHSVNRFKSFNQISNLRFHSSEISNHVVTDSTTVKQFDILIISGLCDAGPHFLVQTGPSETSLR